MGLLTLISGFMIRYPAPNPPTTSNLQAHVQMDIESRQQIPSDIPEEIRDKYLFKSKLGSGSFSDAWEVEEISTMSRYCMKILSLKNCASHSDIISEFKYMQEISSKSPHVVKAYEYSVLDGKVFVLMELCPGGTLSEWIDLNRRFRLISEKRILHKLREISLAVIKCHECHIIHRDLKPDNIFLDNTRQIKLGDFGIARHLESSLSQTFCGTPPYMAPELYLLYQQKLKQKPIEGYGFQVDIWSLGCVLLEMSCEEGKSLSTMDKSLGSVALDNVMELNNIIDNCVPPDYTTVKRLLTRMLVPNPEDRISLQDIVIDGELLEKTSTAPHIKWYHLIS
ncbi:NUAK family SNF1-like kinase 2 [Oopsacas minuta]|uniref:non-specific serine/threonine protein kinase n=1 Tax=Oopsacas minuta TaxID=111878 RepID=A0AAV7JCG5_9METZ|nr:NUAK family SNF1-like kinase 2 [Oopsacas minuta]